MKNIQKNNLYKPSYTLIVSVLFALCCLVAVQMIETTSILGNIVVLTVFLVVLPVLYISIIHHDSWKDLLQGPKNISVSLIVSTTTGLVSGFIAGVINSYLIFSDQVVGMAEILSRSFRGFILYELFTLLPIILTMVFFGYFFVRYIFHGYGFAKYIAFATLSLLLYFWTLVPISVIIPLSVVGVLQYLKKDHYMTVSWSLFLAYFIFDAMIIKTIL